MLLARSHPHSGAPDPAPRPLGPRHRTDVPEDRSPRRGVSGALATILDEAGASTCRNPTSLPASPRPFLPSVQDHAGSSQLRSAFITGVLATLLPFKVSGLAKAGSQPSNRRLSQTRDLKREQIGQHLSNERTRELRDHCVVWRGPEDGTSWNRKRPWVATGWEVPSSSRIVATAPETPRRGARSRAGSGSSVRRRGPSGRSVGHGAPECERS